MTAYADTISRPARTLTESEQRLLLKFKPRMDLQRRRNRHSRVAGDQFVEHLVELHHRETQRRCACETCILALSHVHTFNQVVVQFEANPARRLHDSRRKRKNMLLSLR